MVKKRYFSAHFDFKTGFIYKFFFIIGLVLLVFCIIQQVFAVIANDVNIAGISLAFSILFFGSGILIYFLHTQFAKLSKIADEIENEELNNSE